jgi:signal transduction histidine kinase
LLIAVSLLASARCAVTACRPTLSSWERTSQANRELPARQTPADAARIEELRQLLARFVGVERAARALAGEQLSIEGALTRTERVLSGTLGAASARVIVAAVSRRGRLLPRSARAIIDEASEAIRYNYEILRNTLDHVGMGIAAFDREGRLEIYNDRFTALLSLDDDAVAVGAAPREFGATAEVVALLRRPGAPQTHEIATREGRVIELRLDPLPGDGFVATCNDVTARVRTAEALRDSDRQLRQSKETLEQRVVERTAELESSRAEAEAANLGKTRFIAAASHDLLQPLHAARLFTAALIDRAPENDLSGKIDASLGAVESLLDALLDISKLDAGAFKPEKRAVRSAAAVRVARNCLCADRRPSTVSNWWWCRTRAFVDTDPAFLRRILQNFLSNALRYGQQSKAAPARVLLGCRRAGEELRIEVRDNGAGIPIPISRRSSSTNSCVCSPRTTGPREERGLGSGSCHRRPHCPNAGLARWHSSSAPGRGFDVLCYCAARRCRRGSAQLPPPVPQPRRPSSAESFVLCLDNESQVYARRWPSLLGGWGCQAS